MSFPFLQPYAGLSNSLQTAQAGGAGGVGGWVELGRTTLGSNGNSIDVTSLPDKRYYMLLFNGIPTTSCSDTLRINGDSGSNYSWRVYVPGSGEIASTGTSALGGSYIASSDTSPRFHVGYYANLASNEKLEILQASSSGTSGAGNAPNRREWVGKWANTSNAINRFNYLGSNNFSTGSEVVVLGWDPADTHTSNFWEELASVETSVTGELSSGTFTAKKYLWVQAYTPSSSNASPDGYVEFNADSGTNYASRRSHNGGSDTTATNDGTGIRIDGTGGQTAKFHNLFILNNSSDEKLVISHSITANTAGAGTAPSRTESVGKWVNTSNQITRVDIIDQYASSQWGAGSTIKVWGAD